MTNRAPDNQTGNSQTPLNTDLVSLAAPVLDLILRIKSGIVAPSTELRRQVAALLAKFEERAGRFRHPDRITKLAKFALAAFVDETVLTNDFPLKDEWEKYPLQLEYFGEQLAGVKFFERLEAMLKQIEAAVDAVEVYYVCLLLGFKGKYAVYQENELHNIIRRTAEALKQAGRIQNIDIAPNAFIDDQPAPLKKPNFLPAWAKVFAASGLALSVLIYIGLLVFVNRSLSAALEKLLF